MLNTLPTSAYLRNSARAKAQACQMGFTWLLENLSCLLAPPTKEHAQALFSYLFPSSVSCITVCCLPLLLVCFLGPSPTRQHTPQKNWILAWFLL